MELKKLRRKIKDNKVNKKRGKKIYLVIGGLGRIGEPATLP